MNFFGLPRHLWWSHHFAFLLHDFLADVVVRGGREGIFLMRFKLADEAEADSMQRVGDGDILEWLCDHGRTDIAQGVLERTVALALLDDMAHFLFESIESMAKGKVTVAYSLLRKPFRDHLFVLEWLLVDPAGFLAEFRKGPEAIDISALLNTSRDFMKQTVQDSIARSAFGEFVDNELTWELRFEKSKEWGLEQHWNRAIHLATTHKHYRTEVENLNFALLQPEDRDKLVQEYYQRVPMILLHACGVVRALLQRWNVEFDFKERLFELRVLANAELWLAEMPADETMDSYATTALNEILRNIDLDCEDCEELLQLEASHDLQHLARDGLVRCRRCGHLSAQLWHLDDTGNEDDGVGEGETTKH